MIGSTPLARRAGNQQAMKATAASSIVTDKMATQKRYPQGLKIIEPNRVYLGDRTLCFGYRALLNSKLNAISLPLSGIHQAALASRTPGKIAMRANSLV